jgi:hypothetical protein
VAKHSQINLKAALELGKYNLVQEMESSTSNLLNGLVYLLSICDIREHFFILDGCCQYCCAYVSGNDRPRWTQDGWDIGVR